MRDDNREATQHAHRIDEASALLASRRYAQAIVAAEGAIGELDASGETTAEVAAQECRLLLVIIDAERQLGHVERCRELAFQATDKASACGDANLFGRAALGVDRRALTAAETIVPDLRGHDLLRQALQQLDVREHQLRARLLIALSRCLLPPDEEASHGFRVRRKLAAEALASARRSGDDSVVAEAMGNFAFALDDPGSVDADLRAIARRSTQTEVKLWALAVRIDVTLREADPQLYQTIEMLRTLAEEVGHPVFRWYAAVWSAMAARQHGDLDESERLATVALQVGQELERPNAAAVYIAQVQAIRLDTGQLDELATSTRAFLDLNTPTTGMLAMASDLYAELGDRIAAAELFDRAVADVLANEGAGLVYSCLLVRPCVFLRRLEQAAVLRERLLPHAGQIAVVPPALITMYPVALYLGLLAAALSRWKESLSWFEKAECIASRMGARAADAQTRLEHARTLMRSPRRESHTISELLDAAVRLASTCGMQNLVDAARELSRAPELAAGPELLSARELEVASLVGKGMRNQEIGERLHLSRRTVEAHIQRIRDKFAFRSRAALAAWATRQGLGGDGGPNDAAS